MQPGARVASVLFCLLGFVGCGDDHTPAGAAGVCGGQVPQGEECNSLVDVSTPITPTCVTGEMPVGSGGDLADGTYVLTQQIYYNQPGCPSVPMGGTLVISGDCVQTANAKFSITANASNMVSGNTITTTLTCLSSAISATAFTPDEPTHTFTATPTTLTLFHLNSAAGNSNPDRVEVFTRR